MMLCYVNILSHAGEVNLTVHLMSLFRDKFAFADQISIVTINECHCCDSTGRYILLHCYIFIFFLLCYSDIKPVLCVSGQQLYEFSKVQWDTSLLYSHIFWR